MTLILGAVALLVISGFITLLFCPHSTVALKISMGGVLGASVLGVIPASGILFGRDPVFLTLPWDMPFGAFAVGMDRLSALFLIPILVLSALAAVYGTGYLKNDPGRKSANASFFFNLLIASMILVCIARNGLLFLLAWEGMSISSFFLVAHDKERIEVRKAAWTYLVATTLGTLFLIPMFLILGKHSGSLDFTAFGGILTPGTANLCFLLALVGFGTKAGLMPFHIWLPEAHPQAPSHVSAVMSGVMIKTGIYGLIRVLMFLGQPPLWWGLLLIAMGSISGILGVLYALAQHDLKRLLAYHSVENIGIITLGLGTGVVGMSTGIPAVAVLGFTGALFHVVNHALFKGLFFLGAGSVLHAAHTGEMDHLGGLFKRMPYTGLTFLVGAAAISGLPPLNGFVSEFFIFLSAFRGTISMHGAAAASSAVVIVSLALIGGLAVACFSKAFGIVFLGEPRSANASSAKESGPSMLVPMIVLSAFCILLGLMGWLAVRCIIPAVEAAFRMETGAWAIQSQNALRNVTLGSAFLIVIAVVTAVARRMLLSRGVVRRGETWGCGYSFPSPKMQYTASSFAQPIVDLFRPVLRTQKHPVPLSGYFPESARFESTTPDLGKENVYVPVFSGIERMLSKIRILQQGRSQIYVSYMVLVLLFLLLTRLR